MSTTSPTKAKPKQISHARDIASRGFIIKLVLMGIVNALGLYGILTSYRVEEWGILAFLVITLAIADYVYFSKRAIPAKYLFPGLVFLAVFQIYVMANTAYVAFTNYGDGHMISKDEVVTQILKTSDSRIQDSSTYPVSVVQRGEVLGLAINDNGQIKVGSSEEKLINADGALNGEKPATVSGGWEVLPVSELNTRQKEITDIRVSLSDDPNDGWLRTDNASYAYLAKSTLTYDQSADTFTDPDGMVYTADNKVGSYVSSSGEALRPGWRVGVGFSNFTEMFTDSQMSGPFLSILLWTFVFAFLSVATTFALGLFLAVLFNDERVKGRRFYRAMFILPYAFPGFLAALVWRGMLNKDFGIINLWTGLDLNWLGDGNLAKLSILGVNLWLGFPYMFLICTGALQSIPGELSEAGIMDGANAWQRFWNVTFPLLLVSTAPLMIASFAFNFNNFSLIFMLTGGGPNYPNLPIPVGETDILISMVYSVAFDSGGKDYGLASAMSILIFVMVGLISWVGFRQTRKLEELV